MHYMTRKAERISDPSRYRINACMHLSVGRAAFKIYERGQGDDGQTILRDACRDRAAQIIGQDNIVPIRDVLIGL